MGGNALLDIDLVIKKAQVKERMVVADFGCGSMGYFVFPLSHTVGKHGEVYAIDILKTALQTIDRRKKQENANNITTIWSNLEIYKATPIEAESIDVGFLVNTLYLSRKREDIIRECTRTIKRHGTLLIVEWKKINIPFGPPIEDRVDKENIKIKAQKLGLSLEDEFVAGQYHYGLIFKKI